MAWFEVVQQIVVAGSAAVGAYAAFSGVSTWKRQLVGKTEYEVGMTVLRAAYKVREAIALLRQPFMGTDEIAAAIVETGKDPAAPPTPSAIDICSVRGTRAAYQVRWHGVSDAIQDLDVARIEAEVVWGTEVADKILELRRHVGDLNWALDEYLQKKSNDQESDLSPDLWKEVRSIVLARRGDKDSYRLQLDAIIVSIEGFVRPRLGHKRKVAEIIKSLNPKIIK